PREASKKSCRAPKKIADFSVTRSMTALDPFSSRDRAGVLRWLGLRRPHGDDLPPLVALARQLREVAPGTRSDVFASMAEFFDTHDLDLCQDTLAAAHDYVTGADRHLVSLVDKRLSDGETITLEWLRKVR